jgi:predicted small integral membrane protein
MDFSWMAWSTPTAIFFVAIALALALMCALAVVVPSRPRVGLLGFPTQRGDRLFVALLGSGFIHLGWLALTDAPLTIAFGLAAVFAGLTLRYA